jgi:hypothetical protein
MNPDMTGAMFVGIAARQRTEGATGSIDLGGVSLIQSHLVISLRVMIGNTLSFNEQLDSVCKSANFHVQAKTIACSMINGRPGL